MGDGVDGVGPSGVQYSSSHSFTTEEVPRKLGKCRTELCPPPAPLFPLVPGVDSLGQFELAERTQI